MEEYISLAELIRLSQARGKRHLGADEDAELGEFITSAWFGSEFVAILEKKAKRNNFFVINAW